MTGTTTADGSSSEQGTPAGGPPDAQRIGEAGMTRTLYWRPGPVQPKNGLSDDLKRAMAPRYWGHDGAARDSDQCELTEADIPYLEDLAAKGVEGATALIKAIREHDNRVVVWIAGPAAAPRKRP
ncbi:MAG: hypothetical protein HOY79_31820 [Streptomyces sp.]|nr:hypothetical protein [Streptomyces sp.]